MPVYVQKRKLRLGRRDLELPGEYEQQLQRREKTVPEPPPPPPLPLGEVLQHALARAGARVLLQPDGSATIDSLDLLLALLDLKEGAIQQILEKAQSPSEELAAKLRLLANRPLRDPLPPGTQKSGIAPEESLRNLLQQTRREGRSRGSAVATSRDFLRSILAIHPDLVELLQRANAKIDLLRELMDEVDFPDDDELKLREQLPEEPFAQKGWNDPLAGLDSVTRRELLQGNASPDPIPVSQLLPLPIETGSEPTKSIPDVTAQSLPFPQTPIVRPLSSAPSPPGGRLRKLTLYNPDLPSPDLIDRASDLLNSGHLIIFPTDLGASALVLLESEDKASELLRYRRSLGQGHTEVLTHQIQTMGQYLPPEFLSTHRKVLAELADLAVAVRLPWSQRHSAIDALDETPRSGWHRGWRVPAHTALLALLATLGKPLLALPSPSNDPQLNALLHHDSRPVGLLVDTPNPSPVTRPAILDLRARPAKLEDPGLPPADPAILRPILQSLSP
jgi:tRNA A37 threonylcarbamoyladenosine synthetase subunit TsaC/SUA5/YrdC